ncbi:MAG: hypothetical protein HY245_00930 [Rhizobiales bacterium]|nr:hypothetical protein [Hyphomicrobiales bacterium]MBI3671999.1 hypothetical protein [Hyphomicrobiales bacterium]
MTGRIGRRRFLGLAGLTLAGCTAEGTDFQPLPDNPLANTGLVYVYRPRGTIFTRGESPYVTVAGKSYGPIKAGAYIAARVPEGDVKVTVQQSVLLLPTIPQTVTVAVLAGSPSYVRVDQNIVNAGLNGGGTISQSIQITEVPADVGRKEVDETKGNG